MTKYSRKSFDGFLLQLLANRLLSPQKLVELVGLQTTNRLLDNAENLMGIPSLGRGTGVVLQGQLHEFLGSIPDIKGQIADHIETMERQQTLNALSEQPISPEFSPKPKP